MHGSAFVKDPASSRFLSGGLAEAEELFGSPLPDVPALERDEGQRVFLVHVHSRLRTLQARFLEMQLAQIGALQARAKPTRRNQPPMSRRRTGLEDAYPTVPKRTRETWHPKRGRGGPTMEESAW